MKAKNLIAAVVFSSCLPVFVGCVQYPTERQSVVDLRPQITFRFDAANVALSEARVLVDGLDSGRMGDFVDGSGSLRVLPGTHVVQVVIGSDVLLNERVYIGDGVTRPFIVK